MLSRQLEHGCEPWVFLVLVLNARVRGDEEEKADWWLCDSSSGPSALRMTCTSSLIKSVLIGIKRNRVLEKRWLSLSRQSLATSPTLVSNLRPSSLTFPVQGLQGQTTMPGLKDWFLWSLRGVKWPVIYWATDRNKIKAGERRVREDLDNCGLGIWKDKQIPRIP